MNGGDPIKLQMMQPVKRCVNEPTAFQQVSLEMSGSPRRTAVPVKPPHGWRHAADEENLASPDERGGDGSFRSATALRQSVLHAALFLLKTRWHSGGFYLVAGLKPADQTSSEVWWWCPPWNWEVVGLMSGRVILKTMKSVTHCLSAWHSVFRVGLGGVRSPMIPKCITSAASGEGSMRKTNFTSLNLQPVGL